MTENQYFYSKYIFSLESGVAKGIINWMSKCRIMNLFFMEITIFTF